MKDKFPGYYPPTSDEANTLWDKALFVFDTCALLNLFSYSDGTQKDFLDVLERIETRLWVPYQVAAELHKNYSVRIAQERKNYKDTIEMIAGFKSQINEKHKSPRQHPFISDLAFTALSKALDDVTKELEESREKRSYQLHDDVVFGRISQLFSGRVGDKPSKERLDEICNEGRARYKSQIPPGYSDDKEKPEPAKFGDLVIWLETIDYAKKQKKPLVFVTDDNKVDWWRFSSNGKGRLLGPRPELISEFLERTEQRCWIYNSESFLRYASPKFKKVSDTSINEVRNTAKESRRLLESIDPRIMSLILKGMQDQEIATLKAAWPEKLNPPILPSQVSLLPEIIRQVLLDRKAELEPKIETPLGNYSAVSDLRVEVDEDRSPGVGE